MITGIVYEGIYYPFVGEIEPEDELEVINIEGEEDEESYEDEEEENYEEEEE